MPPRNPLNHRRHAFDDLVDDICHSRSFSGMTDVGAEFHAGAGTLDPKIMFVAQDAREFPWNHPDWPKLLDLAGVERSDTYMTTVVKHRAATNRAPTAAEFLAGFEYLKEEIWIVQPRIVGLINNAVKGVWGLEAKITTVHGRVITTRTDHGHVTWAPLFGPMYLREPRNVKMVQSGYRSIGKIITGEGALV